MKTLYIQEHKETKGGYMKRRRDNESQGPGSSGRWRQRRRWKRLRSHRPLSRRVVIRLTEDLEEEEVSCRSVSSKFRDFSLHTLGKRRIKL